MKNLLTYVLLALFSLSFQPGSGNVRWVVTTGCSLKVDGSTNVNEFTCNIPSYSYPDTIFVSRTAAGGVQLQGYIRPEVLHFDCHMKAMTDDLRKTLKAKQFPRMTIRFLSLSQYPTAAMRQNILTGQVLIELAGITRRYDVNYNVLAANNDIVHLIGTRRVQFTDFKIDPPRKLGGLIRTDNDLSVVFSLRVKVLD
ncbi:MAG: hypothetical protein ACO1OO_03355 [Flavisolibacter sp.]